MPIVIGYLIGKALGNLIVGILSLLIKLLYRVVMGAAFVVKYSFMASRWLLGKLWYIGRAWYDEYRMNLR